MPTVKMRQMQIAGKFWKKSRVAAELTQWDVAHDLGFSTAQFISNWERGVSMPSIDSLPTLAKLLGLSQAEVTEVIIDVEKAACIDTAQAIKSRFAAAKRGKVVS